MKAINKYNQRADAINSLLCVGLDSELDKLPESFQKRALPQLEFNRSIITETAPYTAAYKFNIAFYEARGQQGIKELALSVEYLRDQHPEILCICDAKRSDIGNTSQAYATAIFDELGFDAVTINPYLGREAIMPFLERENKACIILCRTSNPGSGEIQDLLVGDKPLWHVVAEKVSNEWNINNNCMLVVGATYPEELAQIRKIVGDMTFLVPGIGAQGGDIESVVQSGRNSQNKGLIISSSRNIIFTENASNAAQFLRDSINACRF